MLVVTAEGGGGGGGARAPVPPAESSPCILRSFNERYSNKWREFIPEEEEGQR